MSFNHQIVIMNLQDASLCAIDVHRMQTGESFWLIHITFTDAFRKWYQNSFFINRTVNIVERLILCQARVWLKTGGGGGPEGETEGGGGGARQGAKISKIGAQI